MKAAGRWLFLLALAVYALTAGGSLTSSDAVYAYDLARSLVAHGSIALSDEAGGTETMRGADGRYYSPFGIAQSLYDIPFHLAGSAVRDWAGLHVGKPDTIPKAVVALSQTLLGATIVWQIFVLGARITGSARAGLLAALTCAFGSLIWPYAQFGFGQPLACATLLAAVATAYTGVTTGRRRSLVWCGVWLGAGLLTRHELGLAIGPVAMWVAWAGGGDRADRRGRVLALAPGVGLAVTAWLAYNAVRFGNPFDPGYLNDPVPGFGSSIWQGLVGQLVSPSASVFLYSPFTLPAIVGLVWLWRRDVHAAVLLAAVIVVFLVFYATLGNWSGRRGYGGRYFMITLPFFAAGWAEFLARLRPSARHRAFVIVLALGILVQIPGVFIDYAKISQAATGDGRTVSVHDQQWAWSAAPIVRNTAALGPAVRDNLAYVTGRRTPPPVTTAADAGDRTFSQQFAFSLDLWWLYLFYMGVLPRVGVVVLGLASVGVVTCCSVMLHRATVHLAT